jgi:hypothetical protein
MTNASDINVDSPWKDAIETYFPDFIAFFFPHAQETRSDSQQRKQWKFNLTRRLYEQGYERQDILNLYRFIDWLLVLTEGLEMEFRQEIEQFEQERQMSYISSIERMAMREARQEEVESLLIARFGELDAELSGIIAPLMALSGGDRARMILQLSREELIAQLRQIEQELG